MRTALLADVHANREALEACLEHAQAAGADRIAFVGDLVGYGADPEWVVETAMGLCARDALAVLGNHDAAAAGEDDRRMHEDARAAVAWTRPRLSPGAHAFLAGLPLQIAEDDRLLVHANAWSPAGWEYVAGPEAAGRSLAATGSRLTFCGHLHQPQVFHQATGGRAVAFTPVDGVAIPLGHARRWIAVVGSVGQPRDGNPAACYAIHDAARGALTFHRVAYDAAEAARKIRAAGLPAWLGDRLERGA